MRIGVISDIHSNLGALNSVIAFLRGKNVDAIINAGDNVGYSAFPNECISRLQSEKVMSVQGNYDEAAGNDLDDCGCGEGDELTTKIRKASLEWTRANLEKENKRYLAVLPPRLIVRFCNYLAGVMHGGLTRLNEDIDENNETAILKILNSINTDILILGHTHIPFIRKMGSRLVLNPGSVGKPADGNPDASCAVIYLDGGIEAQAEIFRVRYGIDENIECLIKAGLPPQIGYALKTGGKHYATGSFGNSCDLSGPG